MPEYGTKAAVGRRNISGEDYMNITDVKESIKALKNPDLDIGVLEKKMSEIAQFFHTNGAPDNNEIFSWFGDLVPQYAVSDTDSCTRLKDIFGEIFSRRGSRRERRLRLRELEALLDFYRRYSSASTALFEWLNENGEGGLDISSLNHELFSIEEGTESDLQAGFLSLLAELSPRFSVEWIEQMQALPVQGKLTLLELPPLEELTGILFELQNRARREGLLALEDVLEQLPPLLTAFFRLVVDGTPPDLLDSGMDRYFSSLERRLNEYQEIVADGAQMVAKGINRMVIEELCRKPSMLNLFSSPDEAASMEGGARNGSGLNSEQDSIINILISMADVTRREGLLALQWFPTEGLPDALINLPEIILECADDSDLLGYMLARIFSQLKDTLFHAKMITTSMIRIIYQGESPSASEDLFKIISGRTEGTAGFSGIADMVVDCVRNSEQPFQLLLHLQDYCTAAADYAGALRRLSHMAEDKELTALLTAQIEEHGASFPSLVRDRKAQLICINGEEEASLRRIEMQINTYKIEQDKRDAEKTPALENLHLIADAEKLEQFSLFLLESYARRQQEQERVFSELRNAERARIQTAAGEIFGRELPVFEFTGEDTEITYAEKLFPRSRVGMAALIRDRFSDEDVQNLLAKMTVFNDVLLLNDRDMQKLLRELAIEDLALALKGADEEVVEKFYRNISQRAAAVLQEEMVYMGPVAVTKVREAQDRILQILQKLEEQGEITLPCPEGEGWV